MTNTTQMTQLLNGFKAPTEFYNKVYHNMEAGVAAMIPGEFYTAKSLSVKAFWADLPNNWWRWLAGRCFAHMVSTGQFPVKFVQYKKSCTKHYQTK